MLVSSLAIPGRPEKRKGNVSLRVGRGREGTAAGRLRKPVGRRAKPQDSLRY